MVVPAAFFHALFFKPNDKMKSIARTERHPQKKIVLRGGELLFLASANTTIGENVTHESLNFNELGR